MASNRARGAAFEKRIQDYLKSLGFAVDKARAKIMWIAPGKAISGPNDFFGCADLIAIHPQRAYTLFIQCTLDKSDAPRRIKKLELVPWNHTQVVQLWSKQDSMLSGIRVLNRVKEGDWRESFFRLKTGVFPPEGIL